MRYRWSVVVGNVYYAGTDAYLPSSLSGKEEALLRQAWETDHLTNQTAKQRVRAIPRSVLSGSKRLTTQ